MKSIFEEMGGTYTLGEDGIYYPDLEVPVDEEPHYGKYGRMRKNYIKEHRPWLYTELLFDGKLVSHLNSIDDAARQRMELLTQKMQEQQGVNEELKARDQMGWVGACNNIRNAAEEIVLKELVYC
ncbi:MAG: TnpV protein [Clostridia bacterium]|nr:TnpV protein [Clostridia bacterium]